MRFARYGLYELFFFGGLALGLALVCALGVSFWLSPFIGLPLALIFLALGVFVASFFRDPERATPGGSLDILSPADGTVSFVGSEDGTEYVNGTTHKLSIFLSVFNVHVNRVPLDAEVEYLRYKPGKFLDARHPECATLNEQQIIGMRAVAAGNVRIVVRQIAGLIARRIVCPLRPGDKLTRGVRFGMIKFGSRTELLVDAATCDVEWLVKPGDKVFGCATVVGRIVLKTQASAAT